CLLRLGHIRRAPPIPASAFRTPPRASLPPTPPGPTTALCAPSLPTQPSTSPPASSPVFASTPLVARAHSRASPASRARRHVSASRLPPPARAHTNRRARPHPSSPAPACSCSCLVPTSPRRLALLSPPPPAQSDRASRRRSLLPARYPRRLCVRVRYCRPRRLGLALAARPPVAAASSRSQPAFSRSQPAPRVGDPCCLLGTDRPPVAAASSRSQPASSRARDPCRVLDPHVPTATLRPRPSPRHSPIVLPSPPRPRAPAIPEARNHHLPRLRRR
ncbi:hypothetical protein B0H15DRAFT_1001577, partial [Mycena belliarum]